MHSEIDGYLAMYIHDKNRYLGLVGVATCKLADTKKWLVKWLSVSYRSAAQIISLAYCEGSTLGVLL